MKRTPHKVLRALVAASWVCLITVANAWAAPAAIKRIAIIAALDPPTYTLKNAAPPLGYPMQFWVNKADSKKKARLLNERLRASPMGLGAVLTQNVMEALRERGYTVDVLEGISRTTDDPPDDVDYSRVHADADAVLHIWISEVGIYSSPMSALYLPRVNASARLFMQGHEDLLYEEDLYYGVDSREGKSWGIAPDPKFSFPTFDDVMGRIDEVRGSFDTGAQQIGKRMAEQIDQKIGGSLPASPTSAPRN